MTLVGESTPMRVQVVELQQKLDAQAQTQTQRRTQRQTQASLRSSRGRHMGDYVVLERNRRSTFRIIPTSGFTVRDESRVW